ncbi:MAG: ABC transporter ATP-binding protein, partial [Candidatus Hydrogenedentales bacterium]
MNHLEISGLGFARGDFSLSASLALEKGMTGVILGPSGCGKTTLLRCVAGLERQNTGSIVVEGREIGLLPPEKRNIGFVFQDLALFDHLTGRENIEFGLGRRKIRGTEASLIVETLAEKLKITALLDRRPFAMSGGERQRLAFARAIAIKPGLLLMDEPLSSLDAPLRRELRAYLRSTLSREGITALHVTHDVEEALELGDRIFLMNEGRILARGTPQAIYENPPDAWCVRFLGLGSLLPVKAIEVKGGGLAVAVTPFGRFTCAAAACPASGMSAGSPMSDLNGTDNGGRGAFFFIPRKAVFWDAAEAEAIKMAAAAGAGAGAGAEAGMAACDRRTPGIDRMDAIVERVVFQGNHRRIVLRPLLSGQRFGGT